MEERTKRLETSKLFMEKRKKDFERIVSEEGCQLRMNRSIQVECSFSEIKQNMGFRRFLCRGTENVEAENVRLAIVHNINELHQKIQKGKTRNHLFPLKKAHKF